MYMYIVLYYCIVLYCIMQYFIINIVVLYLLLIRFVCVYSRVCYILGIPLCTLIISWQYPGRTLAVIIVPWSCKYRWLCHSFVPSLSPYHVWSWSSFILCNTQLFRIVYVLLPINRYIVKIILVYIVSNFGPINRKGICKSAQSCKYQVHRNRTFLYLEIVSNWNDLAHDQGTTFSTIGAWSVLNIYWLIIVIRKIHNTMLLQLM